VEITSGGTGGPELDEAYWGVPNNFYARLTGHPPLGEVAEAFYRAGWNVRKAAWDEYEIAHTWAELLLIPPGLVSGTVAPGRRDHMLELLRDLGLECHADPEEPAASPEPGSGQ
jgi:hypothetical protein